MEIDVPHLSPEEDRHGNKRLYVRLRGRRIRLRLKKSDPGFLAAYQTALASLRSPAAKPAKAALAGRWPKDSFGALAMDYFKSEEFLGLDAISQRTRRQVVESCLVEPFTDEDPDHMGNCPVANLSAKKIKRLRDLKIGKPGAANNRKKYLSAMFGWAIEADRMTANPARDVRRKKYATSGFYTWTIDDVVQYANHHRLGSKAMLALALLLYLGARKGDMVRFGAKMIQDEVLKFIPRKTRRSRTTISEKPILPVLRQILDASPCGSETFLETDFGKPFTANGFGNWFRERCDDAKLPKCTAHGLRKIGATIAAENGATVHQLMAIYDWVTIKQAEPYTKAASQKKLASGAMHLIAAPLALPAPAVMQ